jgi:Protein of unknown function (DUF1573)
MKKFLSSATLIAGLLLAGNLFAQTAPAAQADQNLPVMKFDHDTIDYGTVPHNADGYRSFKFKNVGKEPLIINNAHGSCGCTVPTYVHEPIQPGASSEIKVHYATDRVGPFIKTVTIASNAKDSKILVIKGNVLPDPVGATPANPTPTKPITPAGGTSTGGH